jgi:hypothetical protein
MSAISRTVVGEPHPVAETAPGRGGSLEHLLAELEPIDLLLQDRVARLRREQPADDPFRGMAILDAEVDRLLARPTGRPRWAAELATPEPDAALARGPYHRGAAGGEREARHRAAPRGR